MLNSLPATIAANDLSGSLGFGLTIVALDASGGVGMLTLRTFLRDESAATSIEYALIAVAVSIVILTAVQSIGTKVNSSFISVQSGFN